MKELIPLLGTLSYLGLPLDNSNKKPDSVFVSLRVCLDIFLFFSVFKDSKVKYLFALDGFFGLKTIIENDKLSASVKEAMNLELLSDPVEKQKKKKTLVDPLNITNPKATKSHFKVPVPEPSYDDKRSQKTANAMSHNKETYTGYYNKKNA